MILYIILGSAVVLLVLAAIVITQKVTLKKVQQGQSGSGNAGANNPTPAAQQQGGHQQGQPQPQPQPVIPKTPSDWSKVTGKVIAWVVGGILGGWLIYLLIVPIGDRMRTKWVNSPLTIPKEERLTPDEAIRQLDEVVLNRYRQMIVERMNTAYDIPVEETKVLLEQAQGLPDSRFKQMLQSEYGIEMPEKVEHLPMVVEDIPKFTTVNGRRTETVTFLKLNLSSEKESRLLNLYGWVFVITPTSPGFPCEIEYNYYQNGRKTMTARFKGGKYFKVNGDGTETEITVTDMPANDSFTLKLLPGVEGEKKFVIRRSRNSRI